MKSNSFCVCVFLDFSLFRQKIYSFRSTLVKAIQLQIHSRSNRKSTETMLSQFSHRYLWLQRMLSQDERTKWKRFFLFSFHSTKIRLRCYFEFETINDYVCIDRHRLINSNTEKKQRQQDSKLVAKENALEIAQMLLISELETISNELEFGNFSIST